MPASATQHGMHALLQWLDDDGDDIYIPPAVPAQTTTTPPHHDHSERQHCPKATAHHDGAVAPPAVAPGVSKNLVATSGPCGDDDTTRSIAALAATMQQDQRHRQAVADSETDQRMSIAMDAMGCLASLAYELSSRILQWSGAEKKKMETILNNRGLISEDLIKELVEANQAQRNELKQVLMLFQQVSGGGGGRGTTGLSASRGRKR